MAVPEEDLTRETEIEDETKDKETIQVKPGQEIPG